MAGLLGARRSSRRTLILGSVLVLVLGAIADSAGVAEAGGRLTVTDDEAAFVSRHAIVVTQTFDEPIAFPPERRGVSFDGVRFWSKDVAPPSWTVGGVEGAVVQCPQICRLYRKFSDGPSDTTDVVITFRKGGDVRSFGFELQPFGHPNQFVIRVVETSGRVTPIWLPPDAGDTYIGLHSRTGIARVVIHQRPDLAGGETNFAFDRVSRSRILGASS